MWEGRELAGPGMLQRCSLFPHRLVPPAMLKFFIPYFDLKPFLTIAFITLFHYKYIVIDRNPSSSRTFTISFSSFSFPIFPYITFELGVVQKQFIVSLNNWLQVKASIRFPSNGQAY